MIRVIGIDAAEEEQSWEVTGADAAYLACALCQLGWRWATLREDGQDIGGVRLDVSLRKRVPWARAAQEGPGSLLKEETACCGIPAGEGARSAGRGAAGTRTT